MNVRIASGIPRGSRGMWVVGALTLVMGLAPAVAAEPLADRFPAQTLAYVGWAGKNLPFDGSMFGQLLAEPSVGQILIAVHQALADKLQADAQRAALQHGWDLAAIAWQHPVALGLIDLSAGPEGPGASVALLIDLGPDRDAFARNLDALLAVEGQPLAFADATIGKVTYKVAKLPPSSELAVGYIDNLFFAAIGPDAAKALIELTPAKGLAAQKRFAGPMAQVAGDNVQTAVFVDVAALIQRAEQLNPQAQSAPDRPGLRKVLDSLGLADVRALAGTMRVVDRGLYHKLRILTPAPHRGVLKPLAGAPLSEADLADVPEDADLACAASISLESLYGEIKRVLHELKPEAEAKLDAQAEMLHQVLGLSVPGDVLGALGDTWVLCSAPSQGGFLTGTVLSVSAKDANRLGESVSRIEELLKAQMEKKSPHAGPTTRGSLDSLAHLPGPGIEVLKSDHAEIHYVSAAGTGSPVAPAWTLTRGKLWVAGWPQVLQSALDTAAVPPLVKSAAFRQAQSHLSGKPSILCYVDSPKMIRQAYEWLLIGWTAVANKISGQTGVAVKPDWLPPLPSIEKYLWPKIYAVSSDAEGITFEKFGSLP